MIECVSSLGRLCQSVYYKCGKKGQLQAVCKSVIKPAAAPDKAVKQVVPSSDNSSAIEG